MIINKVSENRRIKTGQIVLFKHLFLINVVKDSKRRPYGSFLQELVDCFQINEIQVDDKMFCFGNHLNVRCIWY